MKNIVRMMWLLSVFLFQSAHGSVRVSELEVRVNTIGQRSIQYSLYLSDTLEDFLTYKNLKADSPHVSIMSMQTGKVLHRLLLSDLIPSRLFFAFTVSLDSNATNRLDVESLHRLAAGLEAAFLTADADIRIVMKHDSSEFRLTPEMLESITKRRLAIGHDQLKLLEQATAGNQKFYDQSLDISRSINEADTSDFAYVVDFSFGKPLGKPLGFSPMGIAGRGRLSTRAESVLDRLELSLEFMERGKPKEIVEDQLFLTPIFDVTLIADQKLDTSMLALRLGFEGLFPDLFDLTGGANRLRLKPYLKAGVGYVRHLQVQPLYANEKESFEVFFESYYYLPVLNKLGIIAEATGHFINLKDRGGLDNFTYNASVALGYDLPLEDLKALVTWESGRNEFSLTDDTELLVGLLLNAVSF